MLLPTTGTFRATLRFGLMPTMTLFDAYEVNVANSTTTVSAPRYSLEKLPAFSRMCV